MLVEAPGLATLSVKKELEKLGGFESLTPRKAASRMSLLLSEVATYRDGRRAVHYRKEFEITVSENMSLNGAGFIGMHLASKYIAPGTKGVVDSKINLGMQVRIVTEMGIFKGMFGTKHIAEGESQIQLNKSMLKVGPSRRSESRVSSCMTVTSNGLLPSAGVVIMGQLNDSSSSISLGKKAVPKSFSPKPLKAMMTRLWTSMGVPIDVCEKYVKDSQKPEDMEHYWNIGLNDPTGYLEPDTVFVTDLKKQRASLDQVFVIRSPCTQRKDGRVLKTVSVKPHAMLESMWNWINDLSFGAVLFGTPMEGYKSMTENIADGDLDGDLYFCCWAQSILHYFPLDGIKSEPLELEEPTASPGGHEYNESWFAAMLGHVLETLDVHKDIQRLKGQLYNLSAKKDFDDPAADAFAAASKKTIDYLKHGKPITLPADLIEKVDAGLRKYLVAPCDT